MDDTYMGHTDSLVWNDTETRIDVTDWRPGLTSTVVEATDDDQEPGTKISGWRCEWDEMACTCIVGGGDEEVNDVLNGHHGNRCHQKQPRYWGAGEHQRIPVEAQVRLWNNVAGNMAARMREWLASQRPARTVLWTDSHFAQGGLITAPHYTWAKSSLIQPPEITEIKFNTGLDSITVDELVDMRKEMGEQEKRINKLERRLRRMKRG